MQILRIYGGVVLSANRRVTSATRRSTPGRFYDWQADFPKDLQEKTPEGNTIIDLWFELTSEEQANFQQSVGTRLRTELPIRLTIGARHVEFAVRKQGPGAAALTAKAAQVAQFVGRALRVEHVESVRTAERARQVVEDMLSIELIDLEQNEEFALALESLTAAVKPAADRLSADLAATLRAFLPDVREVEIGLSTDRILHAISSQVQITVDDGVSTELRHKGDGVQSLAALALVRKAAEVRRGALVLAIEEPEAHLHPRAVHQLRDVLAEIAVSQQVVLTTHSGVLVDRQKLGNNILVRANRAAPASQIAEIRDALGVRVGDNLQSAEMVLVVEGGSDSRAVTALVSEYSSSLAAALSSGVLAIESLGSASNLPARLEALRSSLCDFHVLLDNDDAGRLAAGKARDRGLLHPLEENLVTVPGMKDSEFEDLLDLALYADKIRQTFGVDLEAKAFRKSALKWTSRVAEAFRAQGKAWSDNVKVSVKTLVAMEVAEAPAQALRVERAESFTALISQLEQRLQTDRGSKSD